MRASKSLVGEVVKSIGRQSLFNGERSAEKSAGGGAGSDEACRHCPPLVEDDVTFDEATCAAFPVFVQSDIGGRQETQPLPGKDASKVPARLCQPRRFVVKGERPITRQVSAVAKATCAGVDKLITR